jgi:hypothetical protein
MIKQRAAASASVFVRKIWEPAGLAFGRAHEKDLSEGRMEGEPAL